MNHGDEIVANRVTEKAAEEHYGEDATANRETSYAEVKV